MTFGDWAKSALIAADPSIGANSYVKDQIFSFTKLVGALKELDASAEIWVVGTHTCYSANFPVVCIDVPSCGLRVYARNNFANWAITVESEAPVGGLDVEGMDFNNVAKWYFEGFEHSNAPIYDEGYNSNQAKFSFFASARFLTLYTMISRVYNALRGQSR